MAEWIVIVDDDVVSLKRTGLMLSEHGFHATAIRSGKALIDFLKSNSPDLILLDVCMPEMYGPEALRRIRTELGSDTPVIFITGDESNGLQKLCMELGASDFIRKPYDEEALLRRIHRVLHANPDDADEAGAGASGHIGLNSATALLEKQNLPAEGVWMGREALTNVYRYVLRYMERYHSRAFRVLITLEPVRKGFPMPKFRKLVNSFRGQLQESLRSSDLLIEISDTQLFLLLPEIHDYDVEMIMNRLLDPWNHSDESRSTVVTYEAEEVILNRRDRANGSSGYSVVMVDDDPANQLIARTALNAQGIQVTSLSDGQTLLDYITDRTPDLILLDILMPGMDGFETMRRLRAVMKDSGEIPVIFLTADDNLETEKTCLQLGATDFIRKPFLPEVLSLRVRHAIELVRLQQSLSREVTRKTRENEALTLRIVQALAEAIDAKDAYTNGHSGRVAAYARRIAACAGYSISRQDEIYMAGILHDIGKIGIPDEIINKPGRLTAEEYEAIKTHPAIGDRILRTIEEKPELAVAARWHHERYDGTGYPDGLAGKDIPEIARIIAVADAYDAMTSRRSYRDILPPEAVRAELENGKGTQFDPGFADIMLSIIQEKKKQ